MPLCVAWRHNGRCVRPAGRRPHTSLPSLFPRQNAIREKNQALNFLRLSSRIDGVRAAPQPAA